MKNQFLIPIVLLVAAGIAFFQRSSLTSLEKEQTRLSGLVDPSALSPSPIRPRRTPAPHPDSHAKPRPMDAAAFEVRVIEVQDLLIDLVRRVTAARAGKQADLLADGDLVEARKKAMDAFSAMDARTFLALVERLKSTPDLPEVLRAGPAEACMEILMDRNPGTAVEALLQMPGFRDRERAFANAFWKWARVKPAEAITWFETQSAEGIDPLWQTPGLLHNVILAEAGVDPVRALSRILNANEADQAGITRGLGASIAVERPAENEIRAFFQALRSQEEKHQGSSVLAGIRGDYIGQLQRMMTEWPVEEATSLIDSEFTVAEKEVFQRRLESLGDIEEPGAWADWMAKSFTPQDEKHPLVNFITIWAMTDPASAESWLKGFPISPFRDRLVSEFNKRAPTRGTAIQGQESR